MRSLLVVCVLMALVALTPAPGVPGSANAETISIVASDNATVKKGSPDTNESEAQILWIKSNGSDTNSRFTFLRFDVGPLTGAAITSASLDLYWLSTQCDQTVSVIGLNDLADAGKGTTETTWLGNLTWNTRPDGTENLPNANTSGVLAGLPILKADPPQLVSFDLTSALPGLLDSDRNNQLTLILYGVIGEGKFASLTNTAGNPVPTLNVGYSNPIPEPGTLALLGVALLGVGFYAWRKRGVRG